MIKNGKNTECFMVPISVNMFESYDERLTKLSAEFLGDKDTINEDLVYIGYEGDSKDRGILLVGSKRQFVINLDPCELAKEVRKNI